MAVKYHAVKQLDKGINSQLPGSLVLWAIGRNVRFAPGYASKTLGVAYLASTFGSVAVRAAFTFIGTDGAVRTIVCCDTVIYAFNSDFSSYTDITPSPAPTGGASDVWQFALVSGLPILSNGKDAIWKWPVYASALTALSGAPTWAKRISTCMHRLVVSNILEGGYTYPGRVRWTEPGNPENWTIDTTGKAGRFDIMDYNTGIEALANVKAQIANGQKMLFFAERGMWTSDFAQATKQFIETDPDAEILSPKCVCRLGNYIFYLGKQDVFKTAGVAPDAIGLPIRDELFDNLNESALATAFCFPVRATSEVWFCVATGTNTVPDTAFIYNDELKVWTIQGVSFSCHGESTLSGVTKDIIGTAAGDLLQLDSGNNGYSAAAYNAIDGYIETGDMNFDLPDHMKRIAEVIPDLKVQPEVSEMMIRVGVRNRLGEDIKWSDPAAFTIGASEKCDFDFFRKEGKWVRIRFYSDQMDSPWSLAGFTVKYELGGTR
jgi:hypothetical protein